MFQIEYAKLCLCLQQIHNKYKYILIIYVFENYHAQYYDILALNKFNRRFE